MTTDDANKAKEIILKITYVTIASASKDGRPWNTPVYSAFDEKYNFFWVSWKESQHSKNILENPNVFFVIYDSTVPEGTGEGVYIKANPVACRAISPSPETEQARAQCDLAHLCGGEVGRRRRRS